MTNAQWGEAANPANPGQKRNNGALKLHVSIPETIIDNEKKS